MINYLFYLHNSATITTQQPRAFQPPLVNFFIHPGTTRQPP